MDTVDVILKIAETVLQDAKKETITMNLLSVSNNLFCGSLSLLVRTEAVSTFPTPFKPPAEPSLKRKPVNTGGSSPIKKPKAAVISSAPTAARSSQVQVPPGATMGSVTPNFGTMPDGRIICPVCTAMLKDMQKAKRHFESAHSGVVFRCEICGNEQKRKDSLKEHLMKKHQLASDIAKVMADRSQK